ncbi:MAG: branched-chain amino acid transaminase [Gammaproteobacteria bacterium]|nr:branched-chain amino acid transaminase [Gammaproteobacteria bacterium]MBL6819429.1 branched-chain amino acid transaminase [Gammaproteobacteria bacterium]MBL6899047.1 branched-chain amino acid transaminase [Gammaproteobacteria bacterium]
MIMSDLKGKIWMDGNLVEWSDARIHVLTHTLHYGTGVFEGVRAYETSKGPAIFRLEDHTNRLFESAELIGMKIPFHASVLNDAQSEVVALNELNNAYIRPMCFYGSEGMGLRADNLKVHAIVAAWDWGSYLGDDKILNGIKVKVTDFPKRCDKSMIYKAKATGNYLYSMLALKDALNSGFDEALILDIDNNVNEGSGENFFMIIDNTFYTPKDGTVLNGITRQTIMEIASDLNYKVEEKDISVEDVKSCDEAFFTGTAAEVTPIIQVDDKKINNGKPGKITKQIQTIYFDLIRGKIERYNNWLTYIKNV